MYFSQKELISQKALVEFTMPRLHKGKQWYVDFFAYDPASGRLRRKKYMLDRMKGNREKSAMASVLISNLYEKLKAGWNPYTQARQTRHYTELATVFERYAAYLETAKAKGTLKPKTAIDYASRFRQLRLYVEEAGVMIRYAYQFDTAFAVDFLDYLIYDKDVNAKTRNNYRTWLSTLCSWMRERKYIDANPIEPIHLMREGEKFRDALPPSALAKLKEWTQRHNPPFYLACMMEYYTFIRPDELRYIRVGDISIEEQSVFIRPEVSKNRKGQVVALNDAVLKIMIEQEVFKHHSGEFLFGHDMVPGEEQLYVNQFRLEWARMRKVLGFPDRYQFYSLKDSGIRDLANAEGIVYARDQARHTDVSVTNKYLKAANVVHDEAKHFKGAL